METLSTLAAAHAEAGDFAAAVHHEQKAQDLYAASGFAVTPGPNGWHADRLAAYKSSKPYRDPH